MSESLTNDISQLIIERSGNAKDSILKDLGFYKIMNKNIKELCDTYFKQFSFDSISAIAYDIFVKDERIINLMVGRNELLHTKSILKTDFSFIIADCMCIGKNRARDIVDELILSGHFIIIPNIMDSNAKMIRPSLIKATDAYKMLEKIHKARNSPAPTEEDYNAFMRNIND